MTKSKRTLKFSIKNLKSEYSKTVHKSRKNNKTKHRKMKYKRDFKRKSKKYRGGDGENHVKFIFIDKHNYSEIDNLKKSNDEDVINVINDLKHDLQVEIGDNDNGGANLLCLLDQTNAIIGYVLGSVTANKYNYNCHISNVYINENQRGKKYCILMMDKYIKKIMGLYSTIRFNFTLDNTGGEISCRCYTTSFNNNGFIQPSLVDCKNPDKNDVKMVFQLPPHYQTRSVTARTVGV